MKVMYEQSSKINALYLKIKISDSIIFGGQKFTIRLFYYWKELLHKSIISSLSFVETIVIKKKPTKIHWYRNLKALSIESS